jgi:hypothetical protein
VVDPVVGHLQDYSEDKDTSETSVVAQAKVDQLTHRFLNSNAY